MSPAEDRVGGDELVLMRPKLTPGDIGGESQVLLTIAAVESQGGQGRKQRILTFTEYPEKTLWLNNTQLVPLVKHLGDLPAAWVGKRVPVAIVNAEYGSLVYPKLYVVETDATWDQALIAKAWTAPASV